MEEQVEHTGRGVCLCEEGNTKATEGREREKRKRGMMRDSRQTSVSPTRYPEVATHLKLNGSPSHCYGTIDAISHSTLRT